MQDPLSVFCRIAERVQDLEKSLHIFCQIHVLPVAGIEVPRILYTEDRIGKVRGFRGVGGIHIGVGTCHNNGTRRYYMFSDLNADRLKIDLRLHISCVCLNKFLQKSYPSQPLLSYGNAVPTLLLPVWS
mgnify:CR=1 FL=1